jgi:hypothetical protein
LEAKANVKGKKAKPHQRVSSILITWHGNPPALFAADQDTFGRRTIIFLLDREPALLTHSA